MKKKNVVLVMDTESQIVTKKELNSILGRSCHCISAKVIKSRNKQLETSDFKKIVQMVSKQQGITLKQAYDLVVPIYETAVREDSKKQISLSFDEWILLDSVRTEKDAKLIISKISNVILMSAS